MGVILRDFIRQAYLHLRKIALFVFLLIFKRSGPPQPEDVRQILVLRHDRIGDMVLSTPFFRCLKKIYPQARVIVVASQRNHEVIKNNPFVDEIWVYRGVRWFLNQTKARKIDLAIDLFYTYELKTAFLTYLSGARYRIGFQESGREIFFNVRGPGMRPRQRMTVHLHELSKCLGSGIEIIFPEVYLKEEETAWARERIASGGKEKKIRIAIHPGGYYPSQRWPLENFVEVGRRLLEKHPAHLMAFADQEKDKGLWVFENNRDACAPDVFAGLTLRQFMALLSQCNLLLCNNSGALHLASALKIPTVSTMGPTDPILWWPVGDNHIVLRKDTNLALITVDEMIQAAESQLKKIRP